MLPLLKVTKQLDKADCAIACLAMMLGKPYPEILHAACSVGANPGQAGMSTEAILQTALRLGTNLAIKRGWDWETDCGLLSIERKRPSKKHFSQHMVLLKWGLVFDTDGTVWEPDIYLDKLGYRALSLLTEEQ
jgi:hypothetical protein